MSSRSSTRPVNGWQWTGAALELVGLACAAVGFRQTWYEYARGERFLEPMLRPVTSRARAAQNWLRKLLRRPGGVAFSAKGSVRWAPPPDPATHLAGYAAAVTQRINELHQKVQDVKQDLATETDARTTAIRDAQAALTAEIDQVRALSRQVAVRPAATGGRLGVPVRRAHSQRHRQRGRVS